MERTPDNLEAAVLAIDPQESFSLQARDGVTLCNEAVRFMLAALGVKYPRAVANQHADWLQSAEAKADGWEELDPEPARVRAELGFPVVAVWKNDSGGHGHEMLLTIAPDTGEGHIFVAGAGLRNFNCARIEESFGLSLHPRFYAHP